MKKHSLSPKGLSLSQAQSISNLCNQRCRDIQFKLEGINNTSKTLKVGTETYIQEQAQPLPTDTVALLQEKSRLHATQAFLMENMKLKNQLINDKQRENFDYSKIVPQPEREQLYKVVKDGLVGEEWGWEQLSKEEINEYLEAEAYAAHIGQFIHKGGTLDSLRQELPSIKTLEWMEVEVGKKTPLKVEIHHTQEQLSALHEELATLHRGYEMRVNYFKAKVKNAVTAENAKISMENEVAQADANELNKKITAEFHLKLDTWHADEKKAAHKFETERQKEIALLSSLKIEIAPRFQPVIDMFLEKLI